MSRSSSRIEQPLFGVDVTGIQRCEPASRIAQAGGRRYARSHRLQQGAQLGPHCAHLHMIGLHAPYMFAQREVRRIRLRQQQREDVQFFVFMVPRRCDIEVAQHVVRRTLRLRVAALCCHVFDQAREQAQRALYPLVAACFFFLGFTDARGFPPFPRPCCA